LLVYHNSSRSLKLTSTRKQPLKTREAARVKSKLYLTLVSQVHAEVQETEVVLT
jgi:hypothetical protein